MDYSTDVAIYTDCATDESYLYGPTGARAVRVLVVYNYGRLRQPQAEPARFRHQPRPGA
jgi:hypothetical protein